MSDVIVVCTTLAAYLLPGAAVGLSLGLRSSPALAVSPALTLGLVAAAATVASVVDVPWNPLTFAAMVVLVCGVIGAVRLLRRRRDPSLRPLTLPPYTRPSTAGLLTAAGVVVGWIVSAGVLLRGFGGLGNPNQDWDYVFHANALRLIADTDDVDPAALRAIVDWDAQTSFYPNTFHALGALVRDLTGASVFTVLNAQTLMIAGVAGLGLAFLLRALGAPTVVSATAPVLLAGFASFPYDTIFRGPLLPYSTGLALIPAFFLLLVTALRHRRFAPTAGLAAAALLGVQTSTALSAVLIVVPFLAQRWITRPREIARDLVPLAVVGVSAVAMAVPFVTGALSMSSDGPRIDWPPVESVGQATGDLLLLNHAAPAPQYWLSGLLLVGLAFLGRARYLWWWVAGGAVALALFVVSAASNHPLVEDLTAPWWNDRWRFAAIAVLCFAALAAHGLHVLAGAATSVLRSVLPSTDRWPDLRFAAVSVAGLLAVAVLSNGLYAGSNAGRVASAYQSEHLLNAREIEGMRWLDRQPGDPGVVMNDPNDGSPYMSALYGLKPAFGHIISEGTAPGATQRLLLERFNCLDSDAAVRAAVERLGIEYVFLGSGFIRDHMTRVQGLRNIRVLDSLELVYQKPGVSIYRVDLPAELEPAGAPCIPDEGS